MEFAKPLSVRTTPIPGLLLFDLPVHGDNRGWFKENWQRDKMLAAGLPDFGPVQNNISFNETAGTTRGIHAEPWDKYVSVAAGRIFGAWVDLRDGPSFGTVFTAELDPATAVFVPRGVGNAFQTLEDGTAYVYLVNDHWSAAAQEQYTFLNLADPRAGIEWPIPLEQAERSAKDRAHPMLADVAPMPPRRILVTGADGQLGRALRAEYADAGHVDYVTRADLDLTDPAALERFHWQDYSTIINAAAYTNVDGAETVEGRRSAWAVNAIAVARLAEAAARHRLTLVQISSDYVFDGTVPDGGTDPFAGHREDQPFSPLGVYGQTKAAGDLAAAAAPRHFIVRTSWVVGDGPNFVRTMLSLARRGARPAVVADQTGRLTFAEDLAAGIRHLLDSGAPYGTYNLTNTGGPGSWADVAAEVYRLAGADPAAVTPVSTADYYAGKTGIAPRPGLSTLNLDKIQASGFAPPDAGSRLQGYVSAALAMV